jgi:hypothetical protein
LSSRAQGAAKSSFPSPKDLVEQVAEQLQRCEKRTERVAAARVELDHRLEKLAKGSEKLAMLERRLADQLGLGNPAQLAAPPVH